MTKSRKVFIYAAIGVSLIFWAGFVNIYATEPFQDPVNVMPSATPGVTEIPTPTPTSRPSLTQAPTATPEAMAPSTPTQPGSTLTPIPASTLSAIPTPTTRLTVTVEGSISFVVQGGSGSQATLSATVGDSDSNGSITITGGASKEIGILFLIWILSLAL